jgi:hypothetical protein
LNNSHVAPFLAEQGRGQILSRAKDGGWVYVVLLFLIQFFKNKSGSPDSTDIDVLIL